MNTQKPLVYVHAGLGPHLGSNSSKGQTLHDEYFFLPRMQPISD
jgi:hypothetical protein